MPERIDPGDEPVPTLRGVDLEDGTVFEWMRLDHQGQRAIVLQVNDEVVLALPDENALALCDWITRQIFGDDPEPR